MKFSTTLFFLCLAFLAYAQDEIVLQNPSFEDFPSLSHTPRAWFDCGFPGESQVDVHPEPESQFHVDRPSVHGETYVGMTARENETWEAIGQRLTHELIAGKHYAFSISLTKSKYYISRGRSALNAGKNVNYDRPIKLRIWGGKGYCKKEELLAESPLIGHTDWKQYNFEMHPSDTFRYITFEAYYKTPVVVSYNGNILLDNASSIKEVDSLGYFFEEDEYTIHRIRKEKNFTSPSEPTTHDAVEKISQAEYTPQDLTEYLESEANKPTRYYPTRPVSPRSTSNTYRSGDVRTEKKAEEEIPEPVTLLTSKEIETYRLTAAPIDFRRGMDKFTPEALTALQDFVALIKEKENLRFTIFQKEQTHFMQHARHNSLFDAIKETGLPMNRFSLQTKPEKFIHAKIENRYLDIWLHE